MIRTAILIDGGWMVPALSQELKVKYASPENVYENARSVLEDDETLYRLFYYDSMPYADKQRHPLTGEEIDFSKRPNASGREGFCRHLNQLPAVALRMGTLAFRGWKITDKFQQKLVNGSYSGGGLNEEDIQPNFMQKGVDMKIGIDIASLVFKKIVERIILFSADTDMIPAMKLARVEGIQIALVQIGSSALSGKLVADCDFLRHLDAKDYSQKH